MHYTLLYVPTEIRKGDELSRLQEDACQIIETRSSANKRTMEKEEVKSSLEVVKEISTYEWMKEQKKDPAFDVLRKQVGNVMSKEGETSITLEKGTLYRYHRYPTKDDLTGSGTNEVLETDFAVRACYYYGRTSWY